MYIHTYNIILPNLLVSGGSREKTWSVKPQKMIN